jgi:hypothetical protein
VYNSTAAPLSSVPTEYDLRSAVPSCASPNTIFDQGSCGGCWALSTAGTLSDRYCVSSSPDTPILSPQDLLDCVTGESKGCSGGFTEDGFDYVADEGLRDVSCIPFTATDSFCQTSCTTSRADDTRYFTSGWGQYVPSDEDSIKAEIIASGSISAVFEVFGKGRCRPSGNTSPPP